MNENTVLDAIRGDAHAMSEVYNAHIDQVYRFIYHKLLDKHTAEDLTSQVFLKVVEHIPRYTPSKSSITTWIFSIARNTVIDYYRTKKPGTASIEDIWELPAEDNIPEAIDTIFSVAQLREAMQTLSTEEREILTLRFWQNLSFTEIGDILGKKPGTVKMTSFRAMKKLKDTFPLFLLLTLHL